MHSALFVSSPEGMLPWHQIPHPMNVLAVLVLHVVTVLKMKTAVVTRASQLLAELLRFDDLTMLKCTQTSVEMITRLRLIKIVKSLSRYNHIVMVQEELYGDGAGIGTAAW